MKLFSPIGLDSRPIIDRVKESLFNILRKYDLPADKTVADLFAGIGSLGLESLSRGARFVAFVEYDDKVAAVLEKNIEKAGFVKQAKVLRADAFKLDFSVGHPGYDLVFVDPPYVDSAEVRPGSPLASLLTRLGSYIKPGGYVVVRTSRKSILAKDYGRLETIEKRQWGTMAVTIYRCKADGEQTHGS